MKSTIAPEWLRAFYFVLCLNQGLSCPSREFQCPAYRATLLHIIVTASNFAFVT